MHKRFVEKMKSRAIATTITLTRDQVRLTVVAQTILRGRLCLSSGHAQVPWN